MISAGVTTVVNNTNTNIYKQGPLNLTMVSQGGAQGPRGSVWYFGTGVPTLPVNVQDNDKYLNTDNDDIYSFVGGVWILIGNIKGSQGDGADVSWDTLAGKPVFIGAGTTEQEAREVIGAASQSDISDAITPVSDSLDTVTVRVDVIESDIVDIESTLGDQATAIAGKADLVHTHTISQVVGLEEALEDRPTNSEMDVAIQEMGDTKVDVGEVYTKSEEDALLATKAPLNHDHTISQITGLQTALDGKINVGATTIGDWDTLVNKPAFVASGVDAGAGRESLGLGAAALANIIPGVMRGPLTAIPMSTLPLTTESLDDLTYAASPGMHYQNVIANGTIARGYPVDNCAGALMVFGGAYNGNQLFARYSASLVLPSIQLFCRCGVAAGGWGPWTQYAGVNSINTFTQSNIFSGGVTLGESGIRVKQRLLTGNMPTEGNFLQVSTGTTTALVKSVEILVLTNGFKYAPNSPEVGTTYHWSLRAGGNVRVTVPAGSVQIAGQPFEMLVTYGV